MRKIIKVCVKNDLIECEMENGDVFEFDMSFIRARKTEMTEPLLDKNFFQQVFIEFGALSWPNGYEIHADTVVRNGKLIHRVAS